MKPAERLARKIRADISAFIRERRSIPQVQAHADDVALLAPYLEEPLPRTHAPTLFGYSLVEADDVERGKPLVIASDWPYGNGRELFPEPAP